ncbi:hypothetical protein PENANT_c002G01841 [Penicillium antarcticum]|uniref:Major facilitator superfamily (MFS) profile domain-containing protein n=1 Tax=Penicillium antarcticum TaxID=416450 RepID=A0A1V6QKE6_9EURO|nr:hypothetical protein PENANT_c002G01841 [Penicillium antarcticum]
MTTNKKDNEDILVDKEVAKYATDTAIHIDQATNKRLRRMIDKRVLVVMMFTYLIQTLDKGAMSFASIIGIMENAHLADNQVLPMVDHGRFANIILKSFDFSTWESQFLSMVIGAVTTITMVVSAYLDRKFYQII